MTLAELVYDLRKISRGGQVSDDDPLTDRLVANWVHNVRSQLISQAYSKKRVISPNSVSNLGCIDVSLVDASVCCGISVSCTTSRTDIELPNFIESENGKLLITRVAPADVNADGFQIIPYQRASVAGNNRYTKLHKMAFEHQNYIYLIGPDVEYIKRINVQGILENPVMARTFNTCEGKPCWTMDSEYPISRKHAETLKRLVLEVDFRVIVPAPVDKIGDAASKFEINIEKES